MTAGKRWTVRDRDRYGNDIYLTHEHWEHIVEPTNTQRRKSFPGLCLLDLDYRTQTNTGYAHGMVEEVVISLDKLPICPNLIVTTQTV